MNKRRVWALVLSIVMVLSVFAYVPVQNVEAAGVSVQYKSHVQTFGWESAWKRDGEASGTSGKAKRLEGIRITVSGDNLGVRYTTHCQTYGWLPWVSNGEMSGTQGEAKRLEAIKIELTGANAQNYDIYYRVHAQSYGWLAWAKNGQAAGTAGLAKRLEAIQIVLVKKDDGVLTDLNGIKSKAAFPYITPHDCKWKTVVDEPAHETPIYEEQDVYENHSYWPDGTLADDLLDPCAKARWCGQHCVSCYPNCPDPDPAGRCAFSITYGTVWVGTEKVQTGTRHHDAITHQECEYCGLRKQ